MGFICNQNMFILIEDLLFKWNLWLASQTPEVRQVSIGQIGVTCFKGMAFLVENKSFKQVIVDRLNRPQFRCQFRFPR